MKRIITLAFLLAGLLPLSAQNKALVLYHVRKDWDEKKYVVCAPGGNPDVGMCLTEFADKFYDYPMLRAFSAQFTGDRENIDIPVAEFKLDRENNYTRIRLEQEELAEAEARLWTLPGGKQVFVVKLVDHADNTSVQICFFDVDAGRGVMSPAHEPEGLWYGYIDNFVISPTGREIEVKWQYKQPDKLVLQDDGTFVYVKFAPNAIGCYVSDPDPSGITNIRATPGGKIIARFGEKKPARNDEYDDWEDDVDHTLTVFNPKNGWWQILGYYVAGVEIKDEAWIHSSVLALHTRNYGGQALKLYESPSADAKVVCTIKEAATEVRPLDVNEDASWVKVKSKFGTGWIQSEWLCDNPVTNCS